MRGNGHERLKYSSEGKMGTMGMVINGVIGVRKDLERENGLMVWLDGGLRVRGK